MTNGTCSYVCMYINKVASSVVLCCVVFCCVVLCCVVFCCVVLCCVALCCVALRCVVLRCVVLCCVVLRCVVLCCVVLCFVLCYVMSCYVTDIIMTWCLWQFLKLNKLHTTSGSTPHPQWKIPGVRLVPCILYLSITQRCSLTPPTPCAPKRPLVTTELVNRAVETKYLSVLDT